MSSIKNEPAIGAPPMAFAPSNYLGAARIAFAPDDAISAAPVVADAPAAPAVEAPVVAAPAAAVPGSVLYPEADPAAAPAEPDAPAGEGGPDVTGLSDEDAAAVQAAFAERAAEKAARKVELDAMSPEDRATAEKADADAEADEARLRTVPADGVYDIRLPEGVEMDAELLAAISPDLGDLSITNGQAERLAATFTTAITAKATKAAEAWAETVSGWADTAKADPEIGGAKWDQTVKDAHRAIGQFGSPALREYLLHSGGGNNPEMIRAWSKVGAAIGEDNPAGGDPPGKPDTPADKAAVLYPNDTPKGK